MMMMMCSAAWLDAIGKLLDDKLKPIYELIQGKKDVATPAEDVDDEVSAADQLGFFGKYLTIWVLICIAIGTAIGYFFPSVSEFLEQFTVAEVSLPIAILIWVMIFPMTLNIDFDALKNVKKHPRGLVLTTTINWVVQPLMMLFLATLFFRYVYSYLDKETQDQYIAGALILGGSPCTAMVFVWSMLVKGNPVYTLVQVAVNDIIILILYAPTLFLFLGVSDIDIPYDTVILSVVLFVVVPFSLGYITRKQLLKHGGQSRIDQMEEKAKPFTTMALLLTLIVIFVFQGEKIVDYPLDILQIIVPLALHNYFVFAITFYIAYLIKLPFDIAAPAGFIGASSFFELGVAIAISSYGLKSGATLVNVVGVLTEVPIMLSLVKFSLKMKKHFPQSSPSVNAVTLATVSSAC